MSLLAKRAAKEYRAQRKGHNFNVVIFFHFTYTFNGHYKFHHFSPFPPIFFWLLNLIHLLVVFTIYADLPVGKEVGFSLYNFLYSFKLYLYLFLSLSHLFSLLLSSFSVSSRIGLRRTSLARGSELSPKSHGVDVDLSLVFQKSSFFFFFFGENARLIWLQRRSHQGHLAPYASAPSTLFDKKSHPPPRP